MARNFDLYLLFIFVRISVKEPMFCLKKTFLFYDSLLGVWGLELVFSTCIKAHVVSIVSDVHF